MQKAEPQHNHAQPAVRQGKGASLESPQGERIAQLAAMVDASPAMAAQRRLLGQVHGSPAMLAQRKAVNAIAQREETPAKPNNTGLPDNLKSGIESLSGISMDNVKVHYNSSQPAQLNALAYAQGTDIHVAPGQEKHLPHEAWHVVQQAQGRVRPTMQMKGGVPVNDDDGLEHEADVMGAKAMTVGTVQAKKSVWTASINVVQMKSTFNYVSGAYSFYNHTSSARENQVVGVGMEAWLDPKSPVKGSATGDPQKAFIGNLRRTFPNDGMIRGHLLNHDLGGYGVIENLFPITSAANGEHLRTVEYGVKNALILANATVGRGVYYRVNVTGEKSDANDNPASVFECFAQYSKNVDSLTKDGEEILNVHVTSSPKKSGGKRPYGERGFSANADGTASENFPHSPGLATWKHGARKGAQDFYEKVNSGDVAITDAHVALADITVESFHAFVHMIDPDLIDLLSEDNGLFEVIYPAFEAAYEGPAESFEEFCDFLLRFIDELEAIVG